MTLEVTTCDFLINNKKIKATVTTEEKNWRHWICNPEIYYERELIFMHFLRKIIVVYVAIQ
jgi:hypothetical protein